MNTSIPFRAVAVGAVVLHVLASLCSAAPHVASDEERVHERLSLPDAVSESLEHNPELRVLEASREMTVGERVTARAWKNPDLFATPGWRRAKNGDFTDDDFYGELGVSQLVEFPGKRALRVAIAEQDLKTRSLALEAFRYQVRIEVQRTFFAVLAAQKVRAVREQQVEGAKHFAESARARAASGYGTDFETLKARTELVTSEKAVAEADGKVRELKVRLNSLLGRPAGSPLEPVGDIEDARKSEPVVDPLQKALEENFALKAQTVGIERANLGLEAARLEKYPDVEMGPSVEYLPDEQTYKFSVTLPIPLLNRGEGEIQTAAAARRKAKDEHEKLKRDIATSVTTSVQELETARRELALYPPHFLAELKNLAERAERGYASNTTPFLVYLDARRSYFDTLSGYYEALAKSADAEGQLQAAIGGVPRAEDPNARNE